MIKLFDRPDKSYFRIKLPFPVDDATKTKMVDYMDKQNPNYGHFFYFEDVELENCQVAVANFMWNEKQVNEVIDKIKREQESTK